MFLNTDSKYIWLNGRFQSFNDTNIHLLSHTLHYGLGVFEGVRAYETSYGGAIFRLQDHTERLFDAAKKIDITIPYTIDELNAVQKDSTQEFYESALPDTSVWLNQLAFNDPYEKQYLRHPGFRLYPIVGVSWKQANDFCLWR